MHGSDRSEQTLRFLRQFQSLLRDSSYTTTYKFALLKSICDLSIEMPRGSTDITLDAIAARFITIYWEQSRDFRNEALNHGGAGAHPARAITLVRQWRSQHGESFYRFQTSTHFEEGRSEMRQVVTRYAIHLLQPTDGEQFIYSYRDGDDRIRLTDPAIEAFQSLYMLISELIEGQWTRWIQRRNPRITSEASLHAHLFGIDRRKLDKVVPLLRELQGGKSFYSESAIDGDRPHVDHFIPWSISRNDAVCNLVLCTPSENIRFSDSLKPSEQLQRLLRRNAEHADALKAMAHDIGLRWDPGATAAIAGWAYRMAE